MKGTYLGEFEEIVLLATGILDDDAYGVAIRKEIEKQTRRTINIGAVHTALHRLEEKGYLKSKFGEATMVRGGKRKRIFALTAFGLKALRKAQELANQYVVATECDRSKKLNMRFMKHTPPRLAKNLLRRFCHVSFIEEVEGDLDEQFFGNVEERGLFRARAQYWIDVVRAISSGNTQEREIPTARITTLDSLAHFFKIFFRSLRHGRSSAIINITGLVMSLVSFIAIWLYVNDELSYDTFHPDAENVYRICHSFKRRGDGVVETDARAPGLWVYELQQAAPGIEAFTRFSKFGWPGAVRYEKTQLLFEEPQFFWADPNYTDIFALPMMTGADPKVLLSDPSKVIINQTTAKKYFASDDPIGKEIIYSREGMDFPLVVAGVMKDYPPNSHFHPDFIASNQALNPFWKATNEERINSVDDSFTYTFIKVPNPNDVPGLFTALRPIVQKHINDGNEPVFTKLTDIHFTPGMLVELESSGDKGYVYMSACIGVLILIIASINYMNLATARSLRRSKEVGLRKTLGVRKSSLVRQFLGESFMMMFISFAIALAATVAFLPFFNRLTGKTFTYINLFNGDTMLILAGAIALLAFIAGSYPAFYLSRFKPIDVIKGKIAGGNGAENFRKALVVFQFTITMVLIISALVIRQQLSLIQVGKLASNTSRVVTIRNIADNTLKRMDRFRNLLLQNKNIEGVSLSTHLPRRDGFSFIRVPYIVKSRSTQEYLFDAVVADEDFGAMFKLEFVAGRNFSYAIPSDTTALILNESAVRELGMRPDEAIGEEIKVNDDSFSYGRVIGVVKDFQYKSVREKISSLLLFGHYSFAETINVKLAGNDLTTTIPEIEAIWKKSFPSAPFEYWFMDEEFGRMYRHEIQMARLSNYFTAFAIVIACLGLFGLAAFTAEQKTKEIGIRKVLGASVGQVLVLLTNKFVRLVLIACVVAIPLAFYAMKGWLEGFAYRAPLNVWVFLIAGGSILVVTYVTVGFEAFRAAVRNPVDTIKHE